MQVTATEAKNRFGYICAQAWRSLMSMPIRSRLRASEVSAALDAVISGF
jgi:hypothetical protein